MWGKQGYKILEYPSQYYVLGNLECLDIFITMKAFFFFAMSLNFGVFCASKSMFQLTYRL
jgi:hypothetical protein